MANTDPGISSISQTLWKAPEPKEEIKPLFRQEAGNKNADTLVNFKRHELEYVDPKTKEDCTPSL